MNPKMLFCAALAIGAGNEAAAAPACGCGPTYCFDTPEYQAELEKKKAAAVAQGYPSRMVALYDKLDHCAASVTTSPDGFSILHQPNSGQYTVDGWTTENEKNDARTVEAGTMKACYVILSQRAFACCGANRQRKEATTTRSSNSMCRARYDVRNNLLSAAFTDIILEIRATSLGAKA